MWKHHKCLFNMGEHYFQLYFDLDQSCREVAPYQILYNNGKLNGFVFQHLSDVDGER